MDKKDGSIFTLEGLFRRLLRFMADFSSAQRMLRESEVAHRTGLSPSTIRNRCTVGHSSFDPEFPQPRVLGSGKNRSAVGWLQSEILDWMNTRPKAYLTDQLNSRANVAKNVRGHASDKEGFRL
jgi:prophage regulatory protein